MAVFSQAVIPLALANCCQASSTDTAEAIFCFSPSAGSSTMYAPDWPTLAAGGVAASRALIVVLLMPPNGVTTLPTSYWAPAPLVFSNDRRSVIDGIILTYSVTAWHSADRSR